MAGLRTSAVAAVAAGSLALSLGAALPARALPSADAACAITDFAPRSVVQGVKPELVQFRVLTRGCALEGWDLEIPGATVFAYQANPFDTIEVGSVAAGQRHTVHVEAHDDYYRYSRRSFGKAFTVRLATRWLTMTASPARLQRGQPVAISGRIQVANWNTGRWEALRGERVRLLFKPRGDEKFRHVRWVRTDGRGVASVKAPAQRDGQWRLVYPGKATVAESSSPTDAVDVRR